MSFLAPWMMLLGIAAALAVFALHLLTTRRPPAQMLPTARFVPESEMVAVARASTPTDIPLLILRALAMLLIGAAFAHPVLNAPGPQVRTVVALEWTNALTDVASVRAAVRPFIGRGNALVVFDTAAREIPLEAFDTLSAPSPMLRRAALSPMFVVARDAGARIARGADSVRLVVFTQVSGDGVDAATAAWRAAWPGRVEIISVGVQADTILSPRVEIIGALPDDPILPAMTLLDAARGGHAVRLVRGAPRAVDASWVREVPGAVLVLWPAVFADTVASDGVVAFGGNAIAPLVAPLARVPERGNAPERAPATSVSSSSSPSPSSSSPSPSSSSPSLSFSAPLGRAVARWRDGTPAVTERVIGLGCSRTVGIGLPSAGDLVLRPPFVHFLAAMLAPCGGARAPSLPDSSVAWLRAAGPLASGPKLAATEASSPMAKWLLLIALGLLLVEQLVRRRPARTDSTINAESNGPLEVTS